MINPSFVQKVEETERQAKLFFEHNPSLMTPDELIEKAADDGYADDDNIDWDLFKHLMRKYHNCGY